MFLPIFLYSLSFVITFLKEAELGFSRLSTFANIHYSFQGTLFLILYLL